MSYLFGVAIVVEIYVTKIGVALSTWQPEVLHVSHPSLLKLSQKLFILFRTHALIGDLKQLISFIKLSGLLIIIILLSLKLPDKLVASLDIETHYLLVLW